MMGVFECATLNTSQLQQQDLVIAVIKGPIFCCLGSPLFHLSHVFFFLFFLSSVFGNTEPSTEQSRYGPGLRCIREGLSLHQTPNPPPTNDYTTAPPAQGIEDSLPGGVPDTSVVRRLPAALQPWPHSWLLLCWLSPP